MSAPCDSFYVRIGNAYPSYRVTVGFQFWNWLDSILVKI